MPFPLNEIWNEKKHLFTSYPAGTVLNAFICLSLLLTLTLYEVDSSISDFTDGETEGQEV